MFASLGKFNIKSFLRLKHVIYIFFVMSIVTAFNNTSFNLLNTIAIVLSTGLLILLISNSKDRVLSSSLLVFLGLISFPLYLWHYIYVSYMHIFGLNVQKYGVIIIISSIFVSYLTYRFVEIYARRQKSYKFSLFLLFSAIGIVLSLPLVSDTKELLEREGSTVRKIYKQQFKRTIKRDDNGLSLINQVLGYRAPNSYQRATSRDITKKYIAIIGDSHAHTAYPGFAKEFKKYGFETLLVANSGCPPFITGATGRTEKEVSTCKIQIREIYNILSKLTTVEKVILITRGPVYLEDIGFGIVDGGGHVRNFNVESYYEDNEIKYSHKESLYKSIGKTLSFWEEKSPKFYYLLENPELGFSPKNCIKRPFNFLPTECKIDYDVYFVRMNEYRERVKGMAIGYNNITILDPENVFCDKNYCYAIRGGKMLYQDDNHLSVDGSKAQAQGLMKHIFTKDNNK